MTDFTGTSNSSLGYQLKAVCDDLRRALNDANRDKPGAVARARELAARKREIVAEMKNRDMR